MPRTIRVLWKQRMSGWFNFNWPGVINEDSVVHIVATLGEVIDPAGAIFQPPNRKFIRIPSSARGYSATVLDIVPHGDQGGGGGVEFLVALAWLGGGTTGRRIINWDTDVAFDIVTDITVLDNPPEDYLIIS
jgi:hypothetical protein